MPIYPSTKFFVVYLTLLLVAMFIVHCLPQLDFIAAWQNPNDFFAVHFFQFFSDSISYFSIGVPFLITLIAEFKKTTHKKRSRLALLYVLLSIAIGGLISYSIKKTFSVPRPYEVDARILQLSVGGGYSLPSGHTTEAFASTIGLILLFPRWFVIVPMLCWALLVAASRVYLGVHYPFDILAGMFIGSSVAFVFYFCFQKWTAFRS